VVDATKELLLNVLKYKILSFKGLSNGLETQLIFKRRGGKWRLEKLNAF